MSRNNPQGSETFSPAPSRPSTIGQAPPTSDFFQEQLDLQRRKKALQLTPPNLTKKKVADFLAELKQHIGSKTVYFGTKYESFSCDLEIRLLKWIEWRFECLENNGIRKFAHDEDLHIFEKENEKMRILGKYMIRLDHSDDLVLSDITINSVEIKRKESNCDLDVNEAIESWFSKSDLIAPGSFTSSVNESTQEIIFELIHGYHDFSAMNITTNTCLQDVFLKTISCLLLDSNIDKFVSEINRFLLKNEPIPEEVSADLLAINKKYNAVFPENLLSAFKCWAKYLVTENFAYKYKTIHHGNTMIETIGGYRYRSLDVREKNKFLKRIDDKYIKIHPHLDTRYLCYDGKGRFDMFQVFRALRAQSQKWESAKIGNENIFLPSLFCVVSGAFVEIQLQPTSGTSQTEPYTYDDFFSNDSTGYRKMAEDSFLRGRLLQGFPAGDSDMMFQKSSPLQINHSERVVMKYLTDDHTLDAIVSDLEKQTYSWEEKTVQKFVLFAYSTNSVCSFCTPSLVSFKDVNDQSSFPARIAPKLKNSGILNTVTNIELDIFVSACIEYDEQTRDTTDEGQHSGRNRVIPPIDTHLPAAKLVFPNDTIDLAKVHARNSLYEFTGKNIHTYNKLVFRSGSK